MKWSIGAKIGSGFALSLVALLIIGVSAYRTTTDQLQTAERVTHSHLVLQTLEELLLLLTEAETGQRGFVITGEERYLRIYEEALGHIDATLKEATDLTSDNEVQQRRIETLRPIVRNRLAALTEGVELRKGPQGLDAARTYIISGKGKEAMDALRKVLAEMEADENALLKQRSVAASDSVERTLATIVWGTGIAILVLAVVGFAITRNISKPLNELGVIADAIATGDLGINLVPDNRQDEVGSLLRSFARMLQNLREMSAAAQQIAAGDLRAKITPKSDRDVVGAAFAAMIDNLRRTTSELAEAVNLLAASGSEILAATTQVASGAAETGTAIAQTTTTVEEVKQTALVSSQKAKFVADSAQKATLIGEAGRRAVEASMAGMQHIQTQVESIAESVVRLSEQGQAIGEIIATVNDLAEQSNLLSVNAAIEAAKAGEQGKGFAVVAQEVKSLAEQSKQATAQVRTILSDIQKATNAAVLATEQGSKAVAAGVAQSADAGESIRQLADSVTEAAQAATQISASSQQQLVGTDQVALAMENIKQASAQNVAGTRQTEIAARNLHELGLRLKQLVVQYKM
jgi:methyl-accepting chemotaxis protein